MNSSQEVFDVCIWTCALLLIGMQVKITNRTADSLATDEMACCVWSCLDLHFYKAVCFRAERVICVSKTKTRFEKKCMDLFVMLTNVP